MIKKINLYDDSGCLHSPEILIFWVWNNNILFYSVNYKPRDMLTTLTRNPLVCLRRFFLLVFFSLCVYSLMFVSRCTKQKLTNLRERPGSVPAWRSRNSNLGRETHCDLMIQPEVEGRERKERKAGVLWHSKVHHSQAGAGPACHER